jgi:hypothetical protein
LTQGDTGGAVISGIVELLGSVPYSSSLPQRRIRAVAASEEQL